MNSSLLTLLRYLLAFGGGFLVSKGYMDEATLEQVIGSVITLLTVAAGIFVNSKNTAKVAAAQTVLEAAPAPVSKQEVADAAFTVTK